LGTAINADDLDELIGSITAHLTVPLTNQNRSKLQNKCLKYFNEEQYINNLEKLLLNA
jgi:hypothetical protein